MSFFQRVSPAKFILQRKFWSKFPLTNERRIDCLVSRAGGSYIRGLKSRHLSCHESWATGGRKPVPVSARRSIWTSQRLTNRGEALLLAVNILKRCNWSKRIPFLLLLFLKSSHYFILIWIIGQSFNLRVSPHLFIDWYSSV